jgi:hypothetical protein
VARHKTLQALLDSWPRTRPPLTRAHEERFAEDYKRNRQGGSAADGAAQRLERWMHRQVARRQGDPVLELGAGTLNHLPYEPQGSDYDVVEPFRSLWEDSPHRARVRAFYDDVAEIPADRRYGRIVSIAVLEHLLELPRTVAHCAVHLAPGGVFQAGIPSEGGLLWGLAWRFGTGLSYRLRTGLDYGTVMRHEHVNTADEIVAVVGHLFADLRISRFPGRGRHTSFYTYLEASAPRFDRAQALLNR